MTRQFGTPLTRYGSRMPTPTPTAAGRPGASARPGGKPEQDRQAAPPATATVRVMTVCVPEAVPHDVLAGGYLDEHLAVRGTLTARFWASPARYPWHRRLLFGLRPGRPAYCAGGPVRLLDLDGMRHGAALAAGIRHRMWKQVVHGTRPATSWPAYLNRHLTDPQRYPRDRAEADFGKQPRVVAMRMHNAAQPGPAGHLDLAEVEMYQAGPAAYQHYSAASAVTGDAVFTHDGALLAPASDTAADRITYLEHAGRYLHNLPPRQRLLAVTV
ncbi:hypothetical protein AB0368_06750 [Actinoplanes sp. NPDC051475]|uniref:hypothetical protein n=1 Tax=Actinoplanes sp. NPDC051475 TaxID=3157225 RepID=UPI00344C7D52